MESILVKVLLDGEIKELHADIHEAYRPGVLAWIDENRNEYGPAKILPFGCVLVGSPDDSLYFFTLENYRKFKLTLLAFDPLNEHLWPNAAELEIMRSRFAGMPNFNLKPFLVKGTRKLLSVIEFDEPVLTWDGTKGKKWVLSPRFVQFEIEGNIVENILPF